MKKYIVVQYWQRGNSMTIKFQSDSIIKATAVLAVFRDENPDSNFTIVKIIE